MTWLLLARSLAARQPGTLDESEAATLAAETEPSLRAVSERSRKRGISRNAVTAIVRRQRERA